MPRAAKDRLIGGGRAGANKILSEKALQLTGGPNSPPPPKDRNVHGALVAADAAAQFVQFLLSTVGQGVLARHSFAPP